MRPFRKGLRKSCPAHSILNLSRNSEIYLYTKNKNFQNNISQETTVNFISDYDIKGDGLTDNTNNFQKKLQII